MGHHHRHSHNHSHDHSYSHDYHSGNASKSLVIAMFLNLVYAGVEAGIGLWSGSLALLSDAGHNLMDVSSLLLAWIAIKLQERGPSPGFTYGWKKSSILVSLLNSILIFGTVGFILYESVEKLSRPTSVPGGMIAVVAFVGVLVNFSSSFLFHKSKDEDMNMKGAYLHLLADGLVSLSVIVSGLLIQWFGFLWIDPVIGLLVGLVILYGNIPLFRQSLRLSLDSTPDTIRSEIVESELKSIEGVLNIHHIHIWSLSTTENALTAHLVLKNGFSSDHQRIIKSKAREILKGLKIAHVTLETEEERENCGQVDCN
ncbi:cation diffusion facilitator family transporter [Leptospira santarosai]|uniref:Cation diffusion facilitator family transporter n=1 Tax=Leptospira santarosai serovar Arenal str. MAVJ 401 TaxID=1049976 RepID=M6JEB3_9LEPT|nr:cation diffusion facilitator family transporter [Leptospira santarosai]EMN19941.1 cation diffusion facilitator family transporter [Leptospira santarosai serovar Arenal str. MAVJ 401]MDI7185383.1 cation diffusion facilitator family transporter [Leptospira santarosai]MDI7191369.1 cation diffusion facilitator family transporter [Leptospira santarosai]MDI7198964.1 cation diffusion facilitator family transporter [Leptospira santarosai]MDI7209524.1 cation diffusion facilitator family transporter 